MTHSSSQKSQLIKLVNTYPVLAAKNTSGRDGINNRIILISLPYIVQHLTYVYNLCIKHNCFSSNLKTTKVTPDPKAKGLTDINNYRPISVLSPLSKPRRNKYIKTYSNIFKNSAETISVSQDFDQNTHARQHLQVL